nr:folylpolyglutamate synthase/dihydrofolate synthase family protein [Ectobacillus ponti]
MTYEEALQWIQERLKFGIKPGLERMEWMLGELGNPERRLKSVHLAGTNGKGSTLTYMRAILQEAEYKVGTFTSPYIEVFNERISINGTPISNEDLAELVAAVRPVVEALEETDLGAATEFEVITVMMFYYFGIVNPCDIVLIETGLGGRFDSTNVVYPVATVITTIGYDHMHILGETLPAIAGEKAGIIKPGIPLITGVEQPDAYEVIQETAAAKQAKVYKLGEQFAVEHTESSASGEQFHFQCPFASYENLCISMRGAHQVQNAALALMTVFYLKTYQSFLIGEEHIREGLRGAFWLGRFETLSTEPLVIIDGAHNPEGVHSLVETLRTHYSDKRITVLFSALGDKKADRMIAQLETVADRLIFTTFDFPRAVSPRLLAAHCRKEHEVFDDWQEALEQVLPSLTGGDAFIITGSLYFISEIRAYMLQT